MIQNQSSVGRAGSDTRYGDAAGLRDSRNGGRQWFAVYAQHHNERTVQKHLTFLGVEAFLPTWSSRKTWKSGQHVTLDVPLFPMYLFARADAAERLTILRTPGVIRIVGTPRNPIPVSDSEVEFLRSGFAQRGIEPCSGPLAGERVRLQYDPSHNIQGTLIREPDRLRFVVAFEVIQQYAVLNVNAEDFMPARTAPAELFMAAAR
jgi:transcription antitermination factor NusG